MKRAIFLFLIITLVSGSVISQTVLTETQLVGTWRASYVIGSGMFAQKTQFEFTIYSDRRVYSVQDGMQYNGSWKIQEDLFFSDWDNQAEVYKTQTTFIDETTWRYFGLGDGIQYTAVKISKQPTVIAVNLFGKNKTPAIPQSTVINIAQLTGSWECIVDDSSKFRFNIYPDQRLYVVDGDYSVNASWTIQGDRFYEYIDYRDEPWLSKTTFFDGKTWKYEALDNGKKYIATKISTSPKFFSTQAKKIPPPPPSHCIECAGRGYNQCPECNGEGRKQIVRYDSNGRAIIEYETCWKCRGNRKIQCTKCKGSGKS